MAKRGRLATVVLKTPRLLREKMRRSARRRGCTPSARWRLAALESLNLEETKHG